MVGVLVMLIVMGTLLYAFVSARRSESLAQTHLAAQQIARSEAEHALTNAFSNIVSFSDAPLSNTPLEHLQGRLSLNVAADTNDYKDIEIVVKWLAPSTAREQVLTNYLTICQTN